MYCLSVRDKKRQSYVMTANLFFSFLFFKCDIWFLTVSFILCVKIISSASFQEYCQNLTNKRILKSFLPCTRKQVPLCKCILIYLRWKECRTMQVDTLTPVRVGCLTFSLVAASLVLNELICSYLHGGGLSGGHGRASECGFFFF